MVWEIFYPGGSATERSTLQWAADHWHRNKTTQPTNFHLLKDLTIHGYRARVIAMTKSWVYIQDPDVQLHDNVSLGIWLSGLTAEKWGHALQWVDIRMKTRHVKLDKVWNDHWNNHV